MDEFENAMDGLAVVALGVYLAMVMIRGNVKPFLSEVVKEAGFIEFLVALFLFTQLAKIPGAKPFVTPIAFVAVFIIAMRIISGSNMAAFSDFAAGRIGLFDFAGKLFGTQL